MFDVIEIEALLSQTSGDGILFCLTDSADGAAGQTGRTVPDCLCPRVFEKKKGDYKVMYS